MEWKKVKLGDIAVINNATLSQQDGLNRIEYLDTSSITNGTINSIQHLNATDAPSRAQRKVKDNTIIFSTVRPNQCHYGFLCNPPSNLIVSTGFATIDVIDHTSYDPKFVYFLLTQKHIIEHLHTIAQNNASAYPSINPTDITDLIFKFPPFPEQCRIASLLSALDRKITLNRQMNATLEAMARQLYDYWFVQFDFPDHNGKPYKSSGGEMHWNEKLKRNVPKGWTCGTLLDIATYTNGLACQKHRPTTDNKLPVIKIKEMHDGFTPDTEYVKGDIPESVKVYNGDVLFSWSASLEVMLWAYGNGGLNQHLFKVTSKNGYPRSYYLYQLLDYVTVFKRMAEARKTTMGHITQDHLRQSTIPLPPTTDLPKKLEERLRPIHEAIILNQSEISSLTSQRDALLPLLLNGQVSVQCPM